MKIPILFIAILLTMGAAAQVNKKYMKIDTAIKLSRNFVRVFTAPTSGKVIFFSSIITCAVDHGGGVCDWATKDTLKYLRPRMLNDSLLKSIQ